MTVASLATITQGRPATGPMPVTMPAPGRLVVVEALAGQGRELEEGGAAVDQALDPLAGEQLAAGAMALDLGVAATGPHALEPAFQISNKFLHMLTVLAELVTTDVEMRVDARHPSGNLLRNAAPAARAGSAANPSQPVRCGV